MRTVYSMLSWWWVAPAYAVGAFVVLSMSSSQIGRRNVQDCHEVTCLLVALTTRHGIESNLLEHHRYKSKKADAPLCSL
jgi:hypothetical protein